MWFLQIVIDFGLASSQPLPEDKAVDLYVLERAMLSTHPNSQALIDRINEVYISTSKPKKAKPTLERLAQVRMRGRKRTAFG
jgi:TP53 regulating kinase-like protein